MSAVCGACDGRGWVWVLDVYGPVKQDCPACEGASSGGRVAMGWRDPDHGSGIIGHRVMELRVRQVEELREENRRLTVQVREEQARAERAEALARDLDWLVNNGLARTVGHRKYEATTAGRAAAGLLHAAEAPDAR